MVNPVIDDPIKRSIPYQRPIRVKPVFDFNLRFQITPINTGIRITA